MSKPLSALEVVKQDVRYRDRIIISLMIILVLLASALVTIPTQISVYHPPDLSQNGQTTRIGEVPPSTVYAFEIEHSLARTLNVAAKPREVAVTTKVLTDWAIKDRKLASELAYRLAFKKDPTAEDRKCFVSLMSRLGYPVEDFPSPSKKGVESNKAEANTENQLKPRKQAVIKPETIFPDHPDFQALIDVLFYANSDTPTDLDAVNLDEITSIYVGLTTVVAYQGANAVLFARQR